MSELLPPLLVRLAEWCRRRRASADCMTAKREIDMAPTVRAIWDSAVRRGFPVQLPGLGLSDADLAAFIERAKLWYATNARSEFEDPWEDCVAVMIKLCVALQEKRQSHNGASPS